MNSSFPKNPCFNKPLAPLVLPAVYDDVLSYEEWLSKVVYQINQLTDYINSTMQNLEDVVDDRVKANLAEVYSRINQVRAELLSADAELQRRIDDVSDEVDDCLRDAMRYTDTSVQNILDDVSGLSKAIENAIQECKDYSDANTSNLDAKINAVKNKLDLELRIATSLLNQRIDDIVKEFPYVYDPATGFNEDVQTAFYGVYNALRVWAMTAMKYDDQELTAEEYDDMAIKAVKYDTEMLHIMFSDLREMFNPFTGKHESLKSVITTLINELRWNAKTTTEYDGYQATASTFDASTFNAYAQDNNKYITDTTPDVKNKAYENYLLLTTELENGGTIAIPSDASTIRFELLDKCFIIPSDSVNITIDGVTVVVNNSQLSVENGQLENVFAITQVKDVSELDK